MKMPSIIFVIPDMKFLYDYKQQFSLGILYLSSELKKMGCQVSVFDSNSTLLDRIANADIYAFSAVHSTYESCVELAKELAIINPIGERIIGGVYVTLDPVGIDPVFHTAFTYEAEDTIHQYITDYINGHIKHLYEPAETVDIRHRFPDRSLLPDDYIRTESIFTDAKTYTEGGATSIMFSRGCPNRCAFCASSEIYKHRVRFRDVSEIVEEIIAIRDTYGIRQFRVQDNTFTGKKSYFLKLAKAFEPLDIYYRCSTRANHVDEEVAEALYRSGCREVGLGIEVADNDTLKKLNKGVTVEQMENAISCLKKHPLVIRCFFMMGLPFDSTETIQANIDFIERNKVDNIMVSNFIPFPGTRMHSFPSEYNIKSIKHDEFTCLSFASHIPLAPNIFRTDITEEEHISIMEVFYNYMIKREFIH